jgi:hypothetical protein
LNCEICCQRQREREREKWKDDDDDDDDDDEREREREREREIEGTKWASNIQQDQMGLVGNVKAVQSDPKNVERFAADSPILLTEGDWLVYVENRSP